MGRQVYQRIGKNNWHKMENGLPEKRKLGVVVGFNAISGSKNNMVAVGWAGEIWHYDGKMWSACASPTNIALFDVQMVKPDLFYACGQVATLLVGDGKNWKIVEAECEKKIGEWHSMAWFQNKLYLTDSYDLYVLEGDEIKQVKIHPKERIPCAHLHTDGNVLLSTSPKDLWMTTDGKKWTQLHNT